MRRGGVFVIVFVWRHTIERQQDARATREKEMEDNKIRDA